MDRVAMRETRATGVPLPACASASRARAHPTITESAGTHLAPRCFMSTLIGIAALLVAAGCSAPQGIRYVGPSTLGQSTAAGPKDPSAPIAMAPDVPPPGPGLPISMPGRAPVPAGPGAFEGQTESPATIAPSGTIAPGGTVAPAGTVTPGGTDPSTGAPVVAPIVAPPPTTAPA